MSPITRSQRIFFGVICAAALLVAVLGLFAPEYLATIFTWFVLPPLHARFLGAIYAFGAVFMLGCVTARRQAEVRWAVLMIGIWTGMLFIISALHLDTFDFSATPTLIWFASYLIYPLLAVVLIVRHRSEAQSFDLPGATLPRWVRGFLLTQGILMTVLALGLFFASDALSAAWPWSVTPFLAQAYAGPLLAYGLGSLLYPRQRRWLEVRALIPGMFVFSAATLVVSLVHNNLFSAAEFVDLLWFAAFGVATLAFGWMTLRVVFLNRTV